MSQNGSISMPLLVAAIMGICAVAAVAIMLQSGGSKEELKAIDNIGVRNISTESAYLWADYKIESGTSVDMRFGYKENSSEDWQYTDWLTKAGSGRVVKPVFNLVSATTYDLKVEFKQDSSIFSTPSIFFSTKPTAPSIKITEATQGKNSIALSASYDLGSYDQADIRFKYRGVGEESKTTEWKTVSGSGTLFENITDLTSSMIYLIQPEFRYDDNVHSENREAFNTLPQQGEIKVPNYEAVGEVTAIADGDTVYTHLFWVDKSKEGVTSNESVRFAGGMDSPETSSDPPEEGGFLATEFVENLCGVGTEIVLDLDDGAESGTGPYRGVNGRLLAVIFVRENGKWINVNADEYLWGLKTVPSNNWDEYAHLASEFDLETWEAENYPYVREWN